MNQKTSPKRINLALQGGGAHGAFTWGVLDALIEDGRLEFEAISGTSAGAMNAVVVADGMMEGGAAGARRQLEQFWRGVSHDGAWRGGGDVIDVLFGFWDVPAFSPVAYWQRMSGLMSPTGTMPLSINPLRGLLEDLVDFRHVAECEFPKLFLSATNVRDGKIKVFSGAEVTVEAVMASACLPFLFQAVEIDGEAYWDGGYMGNPALFPFFEGSGSDDILLVQVNPVRRDDLPGSPTEIIERASEITFNASLLRELRAIDFVNQLHEEGRLEGSRYRRNLVHRIDATQALAGLSASTKFDTSWRFFRKLHAAGREAAITWLDTNFDAIGEHGTLDLRAEFT